MKYTVGYVLGGIAGACAAAFTAVTNYFQPTPTEENIQEEQEDIISIASSSDHDEDITVENLPTPREALKTQIKIDAHQEKKEQLRSKITMLTDTITEEIVRLNDICQPYDLIFNRRQKLQQQLNKAQNNLNAMETRNFSVERNDRRISQGNQRTYGQPDNTIYACKCCSRKVTKTSPEVHSRNNFNWMNNHTLHCDAPNNRGAWGQNYCKLEKTNKVMLTELVPNHTLRAQAQAALPGINDALQLDKNQLPPKPQEYAPRAQLRKITSELYYLGPNYPVLNRNVLSATLERYKTILRQAAACFSPEAFNIKDFFPKSDYASCVVNKIYRGHALFSRIADELEDYIFSFNLSPTFPLFRQPSTPPASKPALEDVNDTPKLTMDLIQEALTDDYTANKP
jgi:hypothetical protein